MSKKPTPASPAIEDGAIYVIRVAEKVQLPGDVWLLPGQTAKVKGRLVKSFADKLDGEPTPVGG